MRRLVLLFALSLPAAAMAAPWDFGEPVLVAGAEGEPHFHHLDGAGRRHIAASSTEVAVIWEDDRSGSPQVYFATKPLGSDAFSGSERLSSGEEAYEPSIVALGPGRWLAAWEQDGRILVRILGSDGPGPEQALSASGGRQVSLAGGGDGRIAAAWSMERDSGQVVEVAELEVEEPASIRVRKTLPVPAVGDHRFQAYPTLTWAPEGLLVATWEDRRAGHTRLFHSWRESGRPFAPERPLNEASRPQGDDPETAGQGSGVMRVALATGADGSVRAIWLDKRRPGSGYAVWGAASTDGGRSFGPNQIVQDELGDAVQQWHAALAGGSGGFVAAWDDSREGWGDADEPGDVIVSWQTDSGWSRDLVVPGASGPGYQGSPAIALDPKGDLHLVWIESDDLSMPTRLRYLRGAAR